MGLIALLSSTDSLSLDYLLGIWAPPFARSSGPNKNCSFACFHLQVFLWISMLAFPNYLLQISQTTNLGLFPIPWVYWGVYSKGCSLHLFMCIGSCSRVKVLLQPLQGYIPMLEYDAKLLFWLVSNLWGPRDFWGLTLTVDIFWYGFWELKEKSKFWLLPPII